MNAAHLPRPNRQRLNLLLHSAGPCLMFSDEGIGICSPGGNTLWVTLGDPLIIVSHAEAHSTSLSLLCQISFDHPVKMFPPSLAAKEWSPGRCLCQGTTAKGTSARKPPAHQLWHLVNDGAPHLLPEATGLFPLGIPGLLISRVAFQINICTSWSGFTVGYFKNGI